MAAGLDFVARAKIGRATPILSTLPPTSFAGLVAGPFAALLSGAMLHLHGPFAADDFLKTRDRAGHAHLVVPAAIAPDLESAAILEGLASTVLLSRLSAEAGFTSPPSFASPCPLVDLYAIDETAAVAEPRRGASAAQPAPEPHFVGLRRSPRAGHREGGRRSCARLQRCGGYPRATHRRGMMSPAAFPAVLTFDAAEDQRARRGDRTDGRRRSGEFALPATIRTSVAEIATHSLSSCFNA